MNQIHLGSCLCGNVKFKVEGLFESFYLCHCKHCQKDTGSAHAANLFSTTGRLIWLKGEMNIKEFILPSTRHTKSFCNECGSALPHYQMNGHLVVVPAGSLDSITSFRPDAHLFNLNRAAWDYELEDIKKYDGLPK